MIRTILAIALTTAFLAGIGAAQASPFGHAQADAAKAGFITTGGVFDGR